MKDFILIFRGKTTPEDVTPEEMQAHMGRWGAWMQSVQAAGGEFSGGNPLNYKESYVITGENEAQTVTDGPFAESKEMIGGFMTLKAESFEKALEFSKSCPQLELVNSSVELREMVKPGPPA